MDRKESLQAILDGMDESMKTVNSKVVEDVLFLEERLEYLRTLPFIEVSPKDPSKQRPTKASKMYKELLQQYANLIKILMIANKRSDVEEESPLRAYLKRLKEV